ncbi:MAG: hypothetical protein M0T78_01895 [Actinomycetota bacterium]|nr:hypothetical protein [Actinomycetota bacterium]
MKHHNGRTWIEGSKLPLVAFIVTLLASMIITFFVPFGNDTAAHLHLVELFKSTNDLAPYDPWWYFGKVEFVGYSIAYYPIAALTNVYTPPIIAISTTSALLSWWIANPSKSETKIQFSTREMAKRYGFVAICSLNLAGLMLTGAYPFLTSLPFFTLATILLYRRRTFATYTFGVLLGALFSIIATLWVGTLALAIGITRLKARSHTFRAVAKYEALFLAPLFVVALAEIVTTRNLFPKGSYPFYLSDLLELSAFLALIGLFAWKSERQTVAVAALIYFAGAVANFALVHSSLGGNIARIGELSPTITAALVFFPSRARIATVGKQDQIDDQGADSNRSMDRLTWPIRATALVMAIASLFWFGSFTSEPLTDPTATYLEQSANWTHLALQLHQEFGQQRIEYVDTALHEGAYFLPKFEVPLARGWFRQSDQPDNALFYSSNRVFSADYKSWLCAHDLAAVVLPPGPYDYSSQYEASLVANGTNYLKATKTVGRFRIYRVVGCDNHTTIAVYPHLFEVTSSANGQYGTLPIHFARQLLPPAGIIINQSGGLINLKTSRQKAISIRF